MPTHHNENFGHSGTHKDALYLLYCTQIATDLLTFTKRQVWSRLENAKRISYKDMQILLTIKNRGNRTTPSEIAEVLRYDRATVSRSLSKLEKQSLVYNEDNGQDMRKVDILATETGLQLCSDYAVRFDAAYTAIDDKYDMKLSKFEKALIRDALRILAKRASTLADEKRLLDIRSPSDALIDITADIHDHDIKDHELKNVLGDMLDSSEDQKRRQTQ